MFFTAAMEDANRVVVGQAARRGGRGGQREGGARRQWRGKPGPRSEAAAGKAQVALGSGG